MDCVNNMISRELGHILIANDRIAVERLPLHERGSEPVLFSLPTLGFKLQGQPYVSKWVAKSPEAIVAQGFLLATGNVDEVFAWLAVDPKFRNNGIGRLMASFVTDLAIESRKRRIVTQIQTSNVHAIGLTEGEEFEVGPPLDPGYVEYFKELKWQ